jgi:hypothetical protein
LSRTYRNRSTVPHGYVVRDDGCWYIPACCPNKKAQRASWEAVGWPYTDPARCDCHPRWSQGPRFRGKIMRKEKKAYRKEHYRQYRAKVKDRMRHEDWENIPRFRRTSGWLTW